MTTCKPEGNIDINSLEKNMPLTTDFLSFLNDKIMQKKSIINKGFMAITAYKLILVTLFFVFCPSVCIAEEIPPIDDIVEQLQRTYEKINDFQANFFQETTIKSIKKTEIEEGIVFFATVSWSLNGFK